MDAERLEQEIFELLAEPAIARMKKYGMGDKLEPTAERTIRSAAAMIIKAHEQDEHFMMKLYNAFKDNTA